MSGIFSVFNIGTGHTARESNNTIANLGLSCHPEKIVNDGPGGALGTVFGKGMDSKCSETVDTILAHHPQKVNLTGHSRGAILCHMMANELGKRNFSGEINMIVIDPVNMSSHVQKGKELRPEVNLGFYVAIAMENVTTKAFPLTAVTPMNDQIRSRMFVINMPGTHGSGTQDATSAIGQAVSWTIRWFMGQWGSTFGTKTPTPKQLAERFAKIHIENPVQYSSKGLVTGRLISDDKKGMGATITKAFQKLGRQDKITSMLATGDGGKAATDYRDSPYFFNEFHAACFQAAFPAIFLRFQGLSSSQSLVDMELDEIEKGCYYINQSLQMLGMI